MEDKYLWLEDVLGEKSLNWARNQNTKSIDELKKVPVFDSIVKSFEDILGNKDRIAYASNIKEGFVYNFWTDDKNLQGLWRRTKTEDFLKENPTWEILLDLDALSLLEGQKWVFNGADFSPSYKRAMIYLSPGGSDATYIREFSLETKSFIDNGFSLPFQRWNSMDQRR